MPPQPPWRSNCTADTASARVVRVAESPPNRTKRRHRRLSVGRFNGYRSHWATVAILNAPAPHWMTAGSERDHRNRRRDPQLVGAEIDPRHFSSLTHLRSEPASRLARPATDVRHPHARQHAKGSHHFAARGAADRFDESQPGGGKLAGCERIGRHGT